MSSYQSPNEELLDGLEICGLGGGKTKESYRGGEKPGPFPKQRLKIDKLDFPVIEQAHLGHKELLKLKDKDVKPVKDVGGEFGEHEEEEVEVD